MDEFFTMGDVPAGDQSMPTLAKAKSPAISKQPSQVIREPSPVPVATTTLPERQMTDMMFEEEAVGFGN